jgi:hypothetical protein
MMENGQPQQEREWETGHGKRETASHRNGMKLDMGNGKQPTTGMGMGMGMGQPQERDEAGQELGQVGNGQKWSSSKMKD